MRGWKLKFKRIFLYYNFIITIILISYSQISISDPVGFESELSLSPANISVDEFYVNSQHPDYLLVIFTEKKPGPLKNIWLMYSQKKFISFSRPILIANIKSEISAYPTIAANRKYLLAMWQQETTSGNTRIHYTSAKIENLSNEPGKINFSKQRYLEQGSFLGMAFLGYENYLQIVYHKKSGNKISLFHQRFRDVDDIRLTGLLLSSPSGSNTRGNFFPSARRINGSIYLAWQIRVRESRENIFNDEIYLLQSADNGSTWRSLERVTDNVYPDFTPYLFKFIAEPAVVYSSRKSNRWEIFFKYRRLGKWSEPIKVSHTNSNAFKPNALFANDKIRVLWYDYRKGNAHLFLQDIPGQSDASAQKIMEAIPEEDKAFSISSGSHQNPEFFQIGKRIGSIWLREFNKARRLMIKLSDISSPRIELVSSTHPNREPFWSNKVNGKFVWKTPKDTSGISGYAFLISSNPNDIPLVKTHGSNVTEIPYNNLPEGKNYAHIRVIDGAGNFGPVSHYPLWIDLKGPRLVDINSNVAKNAPSSEEIPNFNWRPEKTEDVSSYKITLYKDDVKVREIKTVETKYTIPNIRPGNYSFWVQAQDYAGNLGNPVRYPFVIYIDPNQAEAPLVKIENLVSNFFLGNNNNLLLTVKAQKPKKGNSIPAGVLVSFAEDRFDYGQYQTFPPDRNLKVDSSKEKGVQWLRVRILYRDGRKSKVTALPFFNGSQTDLIGAIQIRNDKIQNRLWFFEKYNIGKTRLFWQMYALTKSGQKNILKQGTAFPNQSISYRKLPQGKFFLSFQVALPNGRRSVAINSNFHSNGRYFAGGQKKDTSQIAQNNQSEQKLIQQNQKNQEIKNNLSRSEKSFFSFNSRYISLTLIIVISNMLLLSSLAIGFLSSKSFRFFVNGVWFKLKWKYGFLK